MPPRLRLTDAEAARLPALLAWPASRSGFGRCQTHAERVLWVVRAYEEADAPLTPALITMLVFEQGRNLALATIRAAVAEAEVAGWVASGPEDAVSLTAAGRERAAGLTEPA